MNFFRNSFTKSLALLATSTLLSRAEEVGDRWGTADKEREAYPIVELPIPREIVLEAGAFETLPDGRIAVGTRHGDVYLISGYDDPKLRDWMKFLAFPGKTVRSTSRKAVNSPVSPIPMAMAPPTSLTLYPMLGATAPITNTPLDPSSIPKAIFTLPLVFPVLTTPTNSFVVGRSKSHLTEKASLSRAAFAAQVVLASMKQATFFTSKVKAHGIHRAA
jgi:hypothetical protein